MGISKMWAIKCSGLAEFDKQIIGMLRFFEGEGHPVYHSVTVTSLWGNGGGGHWLVRMEWRPTG